MAHITIRSNSNIIYELSEPYITKIEDKESSELFGKVKAFINGCWLGVLENPEQYSGLGPPRQHPHDHLQID